MANTSTCSPKAERIGHTLVAHSEVGQTGSSLCVTPTDDAAKLQQRVPLPAIARQSRCLDAKDSTHLLLAHSTQ